MATSELGRHSRDPGFQELFSLGHRRHYPKGQVVLVEGDTSERLFFVVSGSLSVHEAIWPDEQEALMALLGPGDFFGEMGLVSHSCSGSATVRTEAECNLIEVSYAVFMELAQKHQVLWIQLLAQLAARLRKLNRQLIEMPRLSAHDRVLRVVIDIAQRFGDGGSSAGVALRIRREDLGKLSGCSRDTAGQALQTLARRGHVVLKGQTIMVRPWAEARQSE